MALTHQVCHMVEYAHPRHYYHILVQLDAHTLHYKTHSSLFKFDTSPIEYCLGLVVEYERYVFSYSTWDRTSHVLTVSRPVFDTAIGWW